MTELLTALDQFHFLRPLWLLGLALLPVIYWFGKQSSEPYSNWSQAINPRLLKYLLDDAQQTAKAWPLALFITALAVCLVALAGPAWKKIPQPVHQSEDALVIVLDQSLSMLATDLKPSRQVTVKHKLIDLLKMRKEGQTALIVYAGDAHIVSPLTDDTRTIQSMIPALSPLIMPALGSRVEHGIALARQALKDGGINSGRILLVTDGIQAQDIERISEQLQSSQHQLSILTVGTADGGPIPIPEQGLLRDKGEIVIAGTGFSQLQQLAQRTGALIANLSLSDSDLNRLLPTGRFDLNKNTREVEREMDQWQEQGPWLLLLILPFAALAFRRGWLLSLCLAIGIQAPTTEAAEPANSSWLNQLWETADQQAADAFAHQDYQTAGELFSDPQWQASAAYRSGDYKTAAQYFSQTDTAAAHYNRGNALAKLGQLEEASKAYDEALQRDPNLIDAKTNKKLIEALAKQQQNESSSDSQPSDSQPSDENQNQQDKQSKEQSPEQSSEQQKQNQSPQQQGQKQNPDNGEQPGSKSNGQQQEQQGKTEAAKDNEKAQSQQPKQSEQQDQANTENSHASNQQAASLPESELSEEQQQAMEQWLRRIPDDPSVLLKNKFNYQYQQNRQNNAFLPQQEDEVIW